ncbi:hypothetical protein Pfl04_15160 [Planosporangium flavigriseum]|uniref:Uncharacterized protein n=2 Tax=Planosporangium flavigriseum TaxID=373681 RepID=A0A8J3PKR9_9ACTN|nr:hypothetical protein Pfl04_15160 [Planosporangium flavigriseum]
MFGSVLGLSTGALAGDYGNDGSPYRVRLLAKAKPDECFAGIGVSYPPGPPCATGQAKVNQAYVWGLARVGRQVWFGTGTNINCLTSGTNLSRIEPYVNGDFVCEYGQSQVVKQNPGLPPSVGDYRPPQVWLYDSGNGQLTEKTAEIRDRSADDAKRLRTTLGLRAGGSHNGIVLFGGPALNQTVNLFAFDSKTKRYLGSTTLSEYGNIRHMVVADNALYLGVGIGRNGSAGGAVLRWTGTVENPFSFVPVAQLPAQAADLTEHDGRIFISTWPAGSATTTATMAGIWMSPKLSDGAPGLNSEDATRWTQVWNATMYEPDRVVAATYAMGGLASYGGYLYWGTLHVPTKATSVHTEVYPPGDEAATKAAVRNTQRASAVFRGRDFGDSRQKVDLLYGLPDLPAFDPTASAGAGAWSLKSTGYKPLYGRSGFDNPFNTYTWAMAVAGGKLYVGTMDWSYLLTSMAGIGGQGSNATVTREMYNPANISAVDRSGFGGDLWVFEGANHPAKPVSTSGLGNYLNYGVRNIVTDGNDLFVGMANPMNLRTDPNDGVPEGGWELISVSPRR